MSKPKKYKVKYETITVELGFNPRKGICEACGKSVEKGEIKTTQLHHWKYEFKPQTIKQTPILALKNTSELCFACHKCSDSLRGLLETSPSRIVSVLSILPSETRQELIEKLRKILENYRENRKVYK